jgi:hypothetical protein
MKSLNRVRFLNFGIGLAMVVFLLTLVGCAGSPGMTAREVHREHVNTVSTNWLMLQEDIDEFLLIDRPSRLGTAINR